MNTTPENMEWDLAVLLDRPDGSPERARAEGRLNTDLTFNQAFVALQTTVNALEDLGSAFATALPTIDIRQDVHDALAHLEAETRGALDGPYGTIEDSFVAMAQDWTDQLPTVNLKGAIMEAIGASYLSDREVELPYLSVSDALNGLGDSLNNASPEVNLVAQVMTQVAATRDHAANVVPLRPRTVAATAVVPGRAYPWQAYAGAVAAALCVVGAWWLFPSDGARLQNENDVAQNVGSHSIDSSGAVELPFRAVDPMAGGRDYDPADGGMTSAPIQEPNRRGVAAGAKPVITLQDAIKAHRGTDLAAFEQLASLSTEEASLLLQEMDLSLEALLGAAQFLAPEEAAGLLRAAISNDPENESLKYALAKNLAKNPELADVRQEQLQSLVALNQNNSLPHYMLAVDYMARGETDKGLDSLTNGASGTEARPYTLERMREREAVLRASGLDPDVARYLAVTTAGEAEAADIASLRSELLNYGSYYEELGDYETAAQIYDAVKQLGMQVTDGADMALVQRAGLETQQDAMYAIQGIAEVLQKPENVEMLGQVINLLAESITDVTNYISVAQNVINDPEASSTDWSALVEHILRNGDLNISNLLGQ